MTRVPPGTHCPDCDGALLLLDTAIEGHAYQCMNADCDSYGPFGVAGTPEAMGFWAMSKDVQSRALKRARAQRRPGDRFPVVTSYHI